MKATRIALLSLALVLIFPLLSFGTHVRTGEIIYKHVAGYTYEATIITYTKASSTQADRDTLRIQWGDGSFADLLRSNGPLSGGVPQGEIIPGGLDLKYNEYTGTHTFPGPGDYYISATDANRMSSVLNINNGASVNTPVYMEALLRVPTIEACVNNSAVSLQSQHFVGKVLQPLKVNAASFDTDGDSLSFELVPPLFAHEVPVLNYLYPDEVSAQPSQFELNSKTGELTWNPQQQGVYIAAVRVKEWRNGLLVGAVYKELMFVIDDFNEDAPIITGTDLWSKDADSNFYYAINPGDTLALSFLASQIPGYPDVTASSELFEQPVLPLFQTHQMGGDLHAMFTWVPDSQSARISPYVLVFHMEHDSQFMLQEDITVLVKVNGGNSYACADVVSGLSPIRSENELRVTPNPFTESAVIQLPENLAAQYVTLSVYDLAGKLVLKYNQPYEQNLRLNRDALSEGVYVLRVDDFKGQHIGIAKIAIVD